MLKGAYAGSFKVDDTAMEVWFDLLADLPGEAVVQAIRQLAQTVKAFPSVADIRRLAAPREGSAEEVWGHVSRLVLEYGPHGKFIAGTHEVVDGKVRVLEPGRVEYPTFPEQVAKALASIGGVRSILECESHEGMRVLRSQFVKALGAIRESGPAPAAIPATLPPMLLPGVTAIGRQIPAEVKP